MIVKNVGGFYTTNQTQFNQPNLYPNLSLGKDWAKALITKLVLVLELDN